jgi:hypothetical protein
MAHALSADRSAVSKSIAKSFIAMAWLKFHFFTQHTRWPPARRRSLFPHLQLLHHKKGPAAVIAFRNACTPCALTAPVAASTALAWH